MKPGGPRRAAETVPSSGYAVNPLTVGSASWQAKQRITLSASSMSPAIRWMNAR